MTSFYGSSPFVRSATGATGPIGPTGPTGPAGVTGSTIKGATGPTGESFLEILSSSSGLTFVTIFNGNTVARGISAEYSPADGSKVLGNTGSTSTRVDFNNLGTGFTLAANVTNENTLSLRTLGVQGEYLTLTTSADGEVTLNYDLSGSGFAAVSGLTGQLIKTDGSSNLRGLQGATAKEFSNRNEVRGLRVKSYREPTVLLEKGNGVEIKTIEGVQGVEATVDWSRAKTFVVDMTQYSEVTDGQTPLTVNIEKAPQDYSSSFFLIVDGATGTQGIETDTALTYNPSTNILTLGTGGDTLTLDDGGSIIAAGDTLKLRSASGVLLQHDDATKLQTTSSGVDVEGSITVGSGDTYVLDGSESTTSSTSQTALVTLTKTTYGAAKFLVTAVSSSERHITEIYATHDGTTGVATEYGTVTTNGILATYDVDINGDNFRLLATPASSTSTTFKVVQTLIEA